MKAPPLSRHLFLIGMMGAGKSTLAKRLAERLGTPHLDCDEEIEKTAGLDTAEIFERHGEPHFRRMETELLRRLIGKEPAVIATGGGIIENGENRRLIARGGRAVYLDCGAETLAGRIAGTPRPLLKGVDPRERVDRLLEKRAPLYRRAADHTVDTGRLSREQAAADILSWLNKVR